VNVIGYVTGNLGLGVATRNTIHMLQSIGVPTALTDVDPGGKRMGHDTTFTPLGPEADPTPYALNLFHMNPPGLADQLFTHRSWTKHDRVSACVLFWELPVLPTGWLTVLDAMDIVVAPTRFIESAVRAALPEQTCIYYRQTVFIPDDVRPDRERWGVPESATTFVSSFDVSSDVDRKNPDAVVDAFTRAFPGRDDVRLLLKVNSSPQMRVLFADRLERLQRIAEADPRIILIDRALGYAEVMSLYASADVLVSLHRSEGLGLSLMEAMSLGKAVIATGWSGNMDFTTPENSCLVGYDLVPVVSRHPEYSGPTIASDVVWAEPLIAEAVAHMQRLADDPAYAARLGERARADMEATRRAFASGEVVHSLEQAVAPGSRLWNHHARKRRELRRIARGTLYLKVRRAGGRLLRRVGLRKPLEE
jgi:glycosyltransferase involved in cell wall biosynthesis